MTHCPQAILEARIQIRGHEVRGFSGDCLPPLWFDKTPNKSFEQQIEEMQLVIRTSAEMALAEFAEPIKFFNGWFSLYHGVHDWAKQRDLPPLLASFGVSLVERAVMDAMLRAADTTLHRAAIANVFEIDAARIHPALQGAKPSDWLPSDPLDSVYVRHTVGLGDPLTRAEVATESDPHDGFPVTLEEHLRDYGIDYLKIKISNRKEHDLERLRVIARLVEQYRDHNYFVTLDGNEQYSEVMELDELVCSIEADAALQTLWANTLVIEQPLARSIALDPQRTSGLREISMRKPVIIDESDGELHSFAKSLEVGYRGVSSKSCKGPIKSLLNAALIWQSRQESAGPALMMTAEDLCSVGIVPLQSDLCLIATLGIGHVERNGHHYHPGLSYLPPAEQEAALQHHGDLYERKHNRVAPKIINGRFTIGSLQCRGFGFATLPQMNERDIAWELS